MKILAIVVAMAMTLVVGAGCRKQIAQEIEVEIVATYVLANGTWATCMKRDDGVRVQFVGRLGREGDRLPILYIPGGWDGWTYKLTPR